MISLPQATKLEEHNRKYERQRKDKELREKKERLRKAQEEAKKVGFHELTWSVDWHALYLLEVRT